MPNLKMYILTMKSSSIPSQYHYHRHGNGQFILITRSWRTRRMSESRC